MDITELKIRNYEIFRKISHELVRSLNLDELLNTILDITLESMGAESGSIMLVEKNLQEESEPEELVIKVPRGLSQEIVKNTRHKIGEGISGYVAQSKKPMLLFGKPSRPDLKSDKTGNNVPKASIIIPLVSGDKAIGVLNINNKKDGTLFTEEDLELMMTISDEMALAIKNSMVYEESVRNYNILTEIIRSTETIRSTFGLKPVLTKIIHSAEKLVRAEASTVFLINKEAGTLEFTVVTGPSVEIIRDMKLKIGEGIAGEVARTGQALLIRDVTKDPRFTGQVDHLSGFKTRQVICVPLTVNEEIIGVLEVLNKKDPDSTNFTKEDLKVLEIFAAEASIAVNNNMLFDTLGKCSQELREAYDNLKAAQEQMIHSERLAAMGTLAGEVAHELNNPLTGIIGYAQLLQKEIKDGSQLSEMKDIENLGLRCKNIVASLLTFARKGEMKFGPVEINKAIEEVLVLLRHKLDMKMIDIKLELAEGLAPVHGNLQQLQQVFMNLIVNAQDAMSSGGNLTITTAKKETGAEISFSDSGPGMEEEVRKKIFEPFFTTKPEGQGTGLGLSVSLGIIEKHGGKLAVKSKPGKGAVFSIFLPAPAIKEQL